MSTIEGSSAINNPQSQCEVVEEQLINNSNNLHVMQSQVVAAPQSFAPMSTEQQQQPSEHAALSSPSMIPLQPPSILQQQTPDINISTAKATPHGFGVSPASFTTPSSYPNTASDRNLVITEIESSTPARLTFASSAEQLAPPSDSKSNAIDDYIEMIQVEEAAAHNMMKKPSTPLGKVVESGQEHTGRWTREEHDAFLTGIRMYGKEWKKVAAKVKTRTVVQTRTHAQKYFQKLQKARTGTADLKKVSSVKKVPRSASKQQQQQATQAAAELMAQLSKTPTAATIRPPIHSGFVNPTNTVTSNNPSDYNATYALNVEYTSQQTQPYNTNTSTYTSAPSTMSIIAPVANNQNMFPEPSPAACGKRKLAEIAAAQMLAGVASSGGKSTPPPQLENKGLRLQIVNPDSLGVSHSNNNGSFQKKRLMGQASPSTPWDGELEALVSEVKNSGMETSKITDDKNFEPDASDDLIDEDDDEDWNMPPLKSSYTRFRPPLHVAICEGSVDNARMLIDKQKLTNNNAVHSYVNTHDEIGFLPLHIAACLSNTDDRNVSVDMTHLLLLSGAQADCLDSYGNTPLHWAARAGHADVVQVLLLKNCPLDVQNILGETALHWGMRAGKVGFSAVRVLLENGAQSSLLNWKFRRPLDVAAQHFVEVDVEMGTRKPGLSEIGDQEEKVSTRANLLSHSIQSRTLVLHHAECLDHIPKSETDWEAPDRINSIMDKMTGNTFKNYEIVISSEFDRAPLELLSRVHSAEYLAFVNDLSKELERRRKQQLIEKNQDALSGTPDHKNNPVVPFTPMVQKTMMKDTIVKKGSHSDTSFSVGSLRAARRAAGAVQHAVDCVLVGRARNAFCVVRPPGHHAGINGLLSGGESCGFCIFNNVAAGAMHALSDEAHRPTCERCAIVDIDAHHGNGTEEIVRSCQDPGRLFFFSIHLFDQDRRKGHSSGYKFYPGTGDQDDVAHNIINVPIAPLWREKEVLQLTSPPTSTSTSPIHTTSVATSHHNTRNKTKQKAAAAAAAAAGAENNIALKSSTEDSTTDTSEKRVNGSKDGLASDSDLSSGDFKIPTQKRSRSKSPVPNNNNSQPAHYSMGVGRQAYRRAITQRLVPALRAFNPDLILISLGLDAARSDVGNARHYAGGRERMGLDLEPEDYAWTTRKVMEVADICCQGKVISVLEGGYGRTPDLSVKDQSKNGGTGKADVPQMKKLDKSIFSECAIRHLEALIDPYNIEKKNPSSVD